MREPKGVIINIIVSYYYCYYILRIISRAIWGPEPRRLTFGAAALLLLLLQPMVPPTRCILVNTSLEPLKSEVRKMSFCYKARPNPRPRPPVQKGQTRRVLRACDFSQTLRAGVWE